MDLSRIIKWVVIALIAFFAWKFLSPYMKSSTTPKASDHPGFVNSSCIGAADKAAQAWSSGIGRFVNPPYDLDAWGIFRSEVESKIADAQGQCACIAESCHKVQSAMNDLRSLVSDIDGTIRNGSSPDAVAQRQEAIDRQLDEARDLVRAGK